MSKRVAPMQIATSRAPMRLTSALPPVLALMLAACPPPKPPASLAERETSYTYIPLDPLPVNTEPGRSCIDNPSGNIYKDLLDALPDQAVRIAVGQYDASGSISFGPVKVGVSDGVYQVVLDYISVDTASVPVLITRTAAAPISAPEDSKPRALSVFDTQFQGPTRYEFFADPMSSAYEQPDGNRTEPRRAPDNAERVYVPVYVGVGLRLTASIKVLQGGVKLSSLGSIAAEAEANRLSGSLVIQTLGITGKTVSTSIPLPSDLNQTTVQNAILALGSIKAILRDRETEITPRVVGIYNPIGGGQQVVNGIISILASHRIRWYRPCKNPTSASIPR